MTTRDRRYSPDILKTPDRSRSRGGLFCQDCLSRETRSSDRALSRVPDNRAMDWLQTPNGESDSPFQKMADTAHSHIEVHENCNRSSHRADQPSSICFARMYFRTLAKTQ